jgi:hypothetical protein
MRINEQALWKSVEFLEQEPLRFNMYASISSWVEDDQDFEEPPCGTVCCLAGAVCLSNEKNNPARRENWHVIEHIASGILRLSKKRITRLFYLCNWPNKYSNVYHKAKTAAERVAVLRRRVEHFIATDGQE